MGAEIGFDMLLQQSHCYNHKFECRALCFANFFE